MPYSNYKPYGWGRADRTIYEMAWHIHRPQQGPSGTRYRMEGAMGSGRSAVYDRYGSYIYSELEAKGLEALGYVFDKARTKTTLKIGVQVNNGPFAWATFKNISLVRGENHSFEIIKDEATE